MKKIGERQKRFIINGIFILAGMCICVWLWRSIGQVEQETGQQRLEGIEVFLEGEEISALYMAEDALWVGGKDGVKKVDINTGEVLGYVLDDVELIYAAEICASYDGSIWIGHNEGITVIAKDGSRYDFQSPGMTGGRVNAILCVSDRVLAGTMEGATQFSPDENGWQVSGRYTRENGLLSDVVNVLAADEGNIYFGSYLDNRPGGISILSEEGWQYLTVEDGLCHPYINAILPLGKRIYAATGQLTAGGLCLLIREDSGVRVEDSFSVQDGIPGDKVRWLYKDLAGHLWITTESDGLIICAGDIVRHPIEGVVLKSEQGLSDNEIKKIVESEKYYWLGGRYGLTRIEKNAVENWLEGLEDAEEK